MKIITDIIKSHVPHGEYPSYYHESQIEHMMAEYEQQWIAAREALSQPPGNDEWVKASVGSLIVNIDEFTATDSPIRHLNNYRKLKDWSLLTNPTQ